MKKTLLSIAAVLMMAACSETQTPAESASPSLDKRASGTSTPFAIVQMPSTDWNITADTSACGSFVLNWTQQTKPSWVKYVILPTPMFTVTSLCAGGLNTLNPPLYYQYGWGCSFAPSKPYSVKVTYSVTDSAQRKVFVYTSLSDTIMTGRGLWNCN